MALKPGVYTACKKDGTNYYRASVTYRSKHISLGSYTTEDQAHHAYLRAQKLLDSSQMPEDYRSHCILPFDKWIILTNFRDNEVYIRNPIYLRKRYFEYYLSKDLILKFDIDDLFYYSEHKISMRGQHLFVADYGMQVSIAGRYGIRPYAVQDRDYRFINQDSTDYRYENIEIINSYYGVTKIKKGQQDQYKAVIHVKSNYVIGRFNTDTEAAIAYNKAVDCLRKQGIIRNYETNYIDTVSPSVYAELYSGITLPKSITSFTSAEHTK